MIKLHLKKILKLWLAVGMPMGSDDSLCLALVFKSALLCVWCIFAGARVLGSVRNVYCITGECFGSFHVHC